MLKDSLLLILIRILLCMYVTLNVRTYCTMDLRRLLLNEPLQSRIHSILEPAMNVVKRSRLSRYLFLKCRGRQRLSLFLSRKQVESHAHCETKMSDGVCIQLENYTRIPFFDRNAIYIGVKSLGNNSNPVFSGCTPSLSSSTR